MKYLLLILCIAFTGCAASQQQVEKEIEQCVITKSEDHFDSEEKVNASNLATDFEILLIDKHLLSDRSPKAYRNLFNLLNEEKIDSTELGQVMQDAYLQNLDLLYSPALYASEYACVKEAKEKFPEVFESSGSLQGLFESITALQQTNDLGAFVTSITDTVPDAEFQEKMVYRVPVITAMYSIMEQTYSKYRNPE